MTKTCTHCSTAFEITDEDLRFLKEVSPVIAGKAQELPPPTHCPMCRLQRRLATANMLNLYERKCDLTGAPIISNFHPDSPYKVYRIQDWFSDRWDPMEYGQDFDFSRPFFDQLQELSLAVPRPSLHKSFEFDENSDYTNYAGMNKNSYLLFDSDYNRDAYYGYSFNHCESCMDSYRIRHCELCYECVDCIQCYGSAFLQDCENCSDSYFLKNCTGCKKCIMSSNLKNKEYYVENKQVTKEQFEKLRAMLTSRKRLRSAEERFRKLAVEYPQKFMHGFNNENVVGDYLTNSKNADHCFDSSDLWDCRYVFQAFAALKDCMDIQQCGEAEYAYESCFSGFDSQRFAFCSHSWWVVEMQYCMNCFHNKNLFGCIGLNRKEYCILNKQYSKDEYEKIVPKIIEHMRKTKEWGEFFPLHLSVFAYNESLVQEYFPLTQAEAKKQGLRWIDNDPEQKKYLGPDTTVPDDIKDTSDDISGKILKCAKSGKFYKIVPQELYLYQQMQLPLPDRCFLQRHRDRVVLRNPRVLHDRTCAECTTKIRTTFDPKRPEKILCEKCYLTTVY